MEPYHIHKYTCRPGPVINYEEGATKWENDRFKTFCEAPPHPALKPESNPLLLLPFP